MIGLPYPGAAPPRHRDRLGPAPRAARGGPGVDVRLRPDRLRPAAPGPRPLLAGLRRPPPLPALLRLRRPLRLQRHRRRRQHHQPRRRRGADRARGGGRVRGALVGGHGRAGGPAADRHAARHGLRGRHGVARGRPGRAGRRLRDLRRRLPRRRQGRRLRPVGPPAPRLAAGRRPGGGGGREALAAGLRAVEEGQAGRAELGVPLGAGPARLAHRVRGDVPRPAGGGIRPPRRGTGPGLPAPRERAGPGGGRREALRPPLGAQRLGDGRRREDVQVARQLHLAHRPAGPERPARPTDCWSCGPTTARRSR